jgi:hypothetical protein
MESGYEKRLDEQDLQLQLQIDAISDGLDAWAGRIQELERRINAIERLIADIKAALNGQS